MDFIKGLYEARMLRDENNAKDLGSVESIVAAIPNGNELLRRAEDDPNWSTTTTESIADQHWFRNIMDLVK